MRKSEAVAGVYVRLTAAAKAEMSNSSAEHIAEFGECTGIIIGPVHYSSNNSYGPEVDVRWQPSNLRYAYHPKSVR